MTDQPQCTPDADGTCSLCGDVAVQATITSIDSSTGTGTATTNDAELTVALDLLDRISLGDTVLIHQGFAIARVDAS